MAADGFEQYGSAAVTRYGRSEAVLRDRMMPLEARLRCEMQTLEQRLQRHDDLVARAVNALQYLQSAVLKLEQGRGGRRGTGQWKRDPGARG